MLVELGIKDFALVEDVTVRFAGGFGVLTGETGAGKSILVDAIEVLLGERADPSLVRTGASATQLSAVFDTRGNRELAALLGELGLPAEADGLLHLSREISPEGRNPCRVNGRACPLSALRAIGECLVELHGQHEHQALLHTDRHQGYLDRFGGADHLALLAEVAERHRGWRSLAGRLAELRRDEGERGRQLDLLRFQAAEIEGAAPEPGEDEARAAEANRLAHAERLAAAAEEAYRALYEGVAEGMSAVDLAGRAERLLAGASEHDPALAVIAEQVAQAGDLVREAARELTAYRETISADPARLEALGQRLHLLADLKRKYGPDLEAVIACGERCRQELAEWDGRETVIAELEGQLGQAAGGLGEACGRLSESRQWLAARVCEQVAKELSELAMPAACFQVRLERTPDPEGVVVEGEPVAVSAGGADRVEFLFSANPGEPPKPLARIASGGEMSRVMLALKSVLAQADSVATLIFDEIDSGIGGRTAEAVGRKLAALAGHAQVICVTHLPQIAYQARQHLVVEKTVQGGRTQVAVGAVEGQPRVEELARMQAGARVTPAVLEHIRQMLAEAAS